jgi:hypothetical protein
MDDPQQPLELVTLGVDTHAEQHVAAALDERGRLLGTCSIPTTTAGFAELVRWASQYGELGQVGMEVTGSYGRDWPAGCVRGVSASSKWTARTDEPVGGVASRTRSMLKRRHGQCWEERPRPSPRLALAQWRSCGHCAWLVNRH